MEIKIDKRKYDSLLRDRERLYALEAGGVDDWDGYDDSLREYNKKYELLDRYEKLIAALTDVFGECAYEPSERGGGIAFHDSTHEDVISVLKLHGVIFEE